jgi:hypothetical protein
VPSLCLTKTEAAEALAMSVDSFERYVYAELKVIRRGRLVLIPLRELERWADENAEATLSSEAQRASPACPEHR